MKKGFTLLETLIAIAIMTVAVGSAFGMAQKSLQTSYQVKNQTVAYFLAAEGLELVRNIRDNAAIYNKANPDDKIAWTGALLSSCSPADGIPSCDIDPLDVSSISVCPNDGFGCKIRFSGAGTDSIFSRSINVSKIDGEDAVLVTSSVTWLNQTAFLTETLTDWTKEN